MQSDAQHNRGIYYQIDSSNHLSIEYNMLDLNQKPTHFIVTYSSQSARSINFYYLTTGDGGANSTIGVQGLDPSGSKRLYVLLTREFRPN